MDDETKLIKEAQDGMLEWSCLEVAR